MKAYRRAWMTVLAAALLAGTTARAGTAIYDNGWSGGSGAGGTPTSEDGVIMRAGNLLWDASLPATVAGWVQEAGYANAVTFDTRYPGQGTFTNFTIAGNCVISNGVWTHGNNSNAEKYNLTVTVQGGFELQSDGVINVGGLGWDANLGPGGAPGSADAASHGGVGCANYTRWSPGYPTYGSIASPTNLGSGSCSPGGAGGGAVRLVVHGTASIDGTVSANGADYSGNWYSSGSGGSIWLTASNLTGAGTIRADGGTATDGGGGGGGRVAVILTGSDSFGNVALTAYGGVKGGGRQYGGAGTVYRETQSDTPGRGELIVDNADRVNTSTYVATSLSGVRAVTADFARVTLRNAGVLRIDADDALDLRNTTITGDSSDGNDGIQIYGGALLTPDAFAFSNYFVRLHQAGCAFDPTASLTVGTNATLTVSHPHAFSGDLVVAAGGTMTHDRNTTTEAFKLNLAVGGGLTVHTGGVVDVMGRGFQHSSGPGAGTYNIGGASHGGRGSIYANDPGVSGPTYGSIISPTNLGSGAYGAGPGGGAVKLAVTEGAVVNGLVSADGGAGSGWTCGGAGGSI